MKSGIQEFAEISFVAVDENGKPHRIQRKIEDKTE